MQKLGLPYMGSKRKLAPKIVDFIIKENPKAKYFYDLFGGGGAVSFYALQTRRFEKVVYNELNRGVVELLKDVLQNGVTQKYYQWVDRESFNKHKTQNDWFGGLCQVIWSFGNNQRDYLYGKSIVDDKQLLHEIIVNKNLRAQKIFNAKYNLNIDIANQPLLFPGNIRDRRLLIRKLLKKQLGGNFYRLEDLQHLQNLQNLQNLGSCFGLEIKNMSYDDVKIDTPIEETVIYLDPPYFNKKEYREKTNFLNVEDYMANSKYKVYLSSYESSFYEIAAWNHRSVYSATNNNKRVVERLFVNKTGGKSK